MKTRILTTIFVIFCAFFALGAMLPKRPSPLLLLVGKNSQEVYKILGAPGSVKEGDPNNPWESQITKLGPGLNKALKAQKWMYDTFYGGSYNYSSKPGAGSGFNSSSGYSTPYKLEVSFENRICSYVAVSKLCGGDIKVNDAENSFGYLQVKNIVRDEILKRRPRDFKPITNQNSGSAWADKFIITWELGSKHYLYLRTIVPKEMISRAFNPVKGVYEYKYKTDRWKDFVVTHYLETNSEKLLKESLGLFSTFKD